MLEHFEAVEADFQSHYGLDLRELLWGPSPCGVRRVLALVNGLPPDGATVRYSVYHGQQWSVTDELLAALIEEIDYGNRLYFSAHSKKNSQQPKPVKIRRPIDVIEIDGPRPQSTTTEVWQVFGADNVVFEGSEN